MLQGLQQQCGEIWMLVQAIIALPKAKLEASCAQVLQRSHCTLQHVRCKLYIANCTLQHHGLLSVTAHCWLPQRLEPRWGYTWSNYSLLFIYIYIFKHKYHQICQISSISISSSSTMNMIQRCLSRSPKQTVEFLKNHCVENHQNPSVWNTRCLGVRICLALMELCQWAPHLSFLRRDPQVRAHLQHFREFSNRKAKKRKYLCQNLSRIMVIEWHCFAIPLT